MFRFNKRIQKPKEASNSSVAFLACSIKKQQWFPKVDSNGRFYTFLEGLSGAASKANRTYLSSCKWLDHKRKHFQQGAIHVTSPPSDRAALYKKDSLQPEVDTLFGAKEATQPKPPP